MAKVVNLDDRRPASSEAALVCVCGSSWFNLLLPDGSAGGINLAIDGHVTGYAGAPVCRDCGRNAM